MTFVDPAMPLAVRLGRGAKATLFLRLSPGAAVQSMEMRLAQEASLMLVCLQEGTAARQQVTQQVQVGADARCHLFNVTLGGNSEQHLVSTVEGKGGISTVDWLFHGSQNDSLTLSARNVFLGRQGGGEMTMKGVAEDKAQARCNGLIVIGEGGGGTSTYLTQKVLMLDATAKVDAVPGLEIKTNDVKASHSATVTKVSEEDVFYFGARGIDAREARAMYVQGFLSDLLSHISDATILAEVTRSLESRLSTR